jgi:hypothetical protein
MKTLIDILNQLNVEDLERYLSDVSRVQENNSGREKLITEQEALKDQIRELDKKLKPRVQNQQKVKDKETVQAEKKAKDQLEIARSKLKVLEPKISGHIEQKLPEPPPALLAFEEELTKVFDELKDSKETLQNIIDSNLHDNLYSLNIEELSLLLKKLERINALWSEKQELCNNLFHIAQSIAAIRDRKINEALANELEQQLLKRGINKNQPLEQQKQILKSALIALPAEVVDQKLLDVVQVKLSSNNLTAESRKNFELLESTLIELLSAIPKSDEESLIVTLAESLAELCGDKPLPDSLESPSVVRFFISEDEILSEEDARVQLEQKALEQPSSEEDARVQPEQKGLEQSSPFCIADILAANDKNEVSSLILAITRLGELNLLAEQREQVRKLGSDIKPELIQKIIDGIAKVNYVDPDTFPQRDKSVRLALNRGLDLLIGPERHAKLEKNPPKEDKAVIAFIRDELIPQSLLRRAIDKENYEIRKGAAELSDQIAREKAKELAYKLHVSSTQYFGKPKTQDNQYTQYKAKCEEDCNEADKVLEQHRGSKVWRNIRKFLIILGGIWALGEAAYFKYKRGYATTVWGKTASSVRVEKAKKAIEAADPNRPQSPRTKK